jgi:hypothetical protein
MWIDMRRRKWDGKAGEGDAEEDILTQEGGSNKRFMM